MPSTRLSGTIVPLVTPFSPDDSLDIPALNNLIDYVMEQGADALMPTALTGEGPLLTDSEKIGVWDAVFEKANGRIPVVPAVITLTTRKAIELVRAAETRGAPAVMVTPILPELYASRSEDDVLAFYSDVASASSLPIILFNYPSLTGIDFVPSLVAKLAKVENVQYIKESTGDIRRVHGIQRLVGDRITVICGAPNVAMESLCLGCKAWITGIMNDAPRSAQQLMRAIIVRNDLTLARRIYFQQILPLVDVMARNFNPTGTIKAGVCARGVNVGSPRRPGHGVSSDDFKIIKRIATAIAKAEVSTARELEIDRV